MSAAQKKLDPLQQINSDLAAIRERIRRARERRSEIERAPLPRAEAIAHLEREISRLAESFDPRIECFLHGGSADGAGETFLGQRELGRGLQVGPALIAWLAGPALLDKLKARINAFYESNPLALTPTEKSERLAAIDGEILALEFDEEDLIGEAEAAGVEIDRRPDANVAVLLDAIERPARRVR